MFKRIKYYFALRKARKRIQLLSLMIDSIDRAFTRKQISRQQRRQFWHDFVHDPGSRTRLIKEMFTEKK
jgi:hypothetical protein